jgi:hypothetical protein
MKYYTAAALMMFALIIYRAIVSETRLLNRVICQRV